MSEEHASGSQADSENTQIRILELEDAGTNPVEALKAIIKSRSEPINFYKFKFGPRTVLVRGGVPEVLPPTDPNAAPEYESIDPIYGAATVEDLMYLISLVKTEKNLDQLKTDAQGREDRIADGLMTGNIAFLNLTIANQRLTGIDKSSDIALFTERINRLEGIINRNKELRSLDKS